MDISDGLSVDLLRLCDASGCGGILELDRIPVSNAARDMASSSGKQPIEHALGDGEDFELLVAIAPASYDRLVELVGADEAIVCGEVTSRTGLWVRDGARLSQLSTSGYVHGR
jgi:thiamine-monophosphate kinase